MPHAGEGGVQTRGGYRRVLYDPAVRHMPDSATAQSSFATTVLDGGVVGPQDRLGVRMSTVCHDNAAVKRPTIRLAGTVIVAQLGGTNVRVLQPWAELNGKGAAAQIAVPVTQAPDALTPSLGAGPAPRTALDFNQPLLIEWRGATETTDNRAFTALSRTANVVTITFAAAFAASAGAYVQVSGNTDSDPGGPGFAGTFRVETVNNAGPFTATWAQTGPNRTAATVNGQANKCLSVEYIEVYIVGRAP